MTRIIAGLMAAAFAFTCIPAWAQSSPPAGEERAQPRSEKAKKVAKKTKKKARKARKKAQRG